MDGSNHGEIRRRSQSGGFEGFAFEPEAMECSLQGQVILYPEKSAVAEPEALV
jgi:hypothetical protein